jgi:antibiotic biosynthesis monooxygenase (ABM) superfamily enzyme
MIYITQLIFLKKGKEAIFHEFEDFAIPLIEKYNGKLMYRLRPESSAYVSAEDEKPYEIHIVSFDNEADLHRFMKDDSRLKFIHLKNESVETILLIKGEKF